MQFSLASSSVNPHLLDVSAINSPFVEEVVLVVVEVEDVDVSGVDTGLLVGEEVAWLVGEEVLGVGLFQQLPFWQHSPQ